MVSEEAFVSEIRSCCLNEGRDLPHETPTPEAC